MNQTKPQTLFVQPLLGNNCQIKQRNTITRSTILTVISTVFKIKQYNLREFVFIETQFIVKQLRILFLNLIPFSKFGSGETCWELTHGRLDLYREVINKWKTKEIYISIYIYDRCMVSSCPFSVLWHHNQMCSPLQGDSQ